MPIVKVKIFISFDPDDIQSVNTLLQWLYPMRDEVDIFPNPVLPPKKDDSLGLSWKILRWFARLLFFYIPDPIPDRYLENLKIYNRIIENQRANAHIYLFMVSNHLLANEQSRKDLSIAWNRRQFWEWDGAPSPYIIPILVSPSLWKESSLLSLFTPLADGYPLVKFPDLEEGYLTITNQLASLIKKLQRNLNEYRYYEHFPDAR